MPIYFAWSFTPLQITLLSLLVLLSGFELLYLYIVYNRVYRYGKSAKQAKVKYADELPPVSVIVYVRPDDAEGLRRLLPVLLSQDYPEYEVIVVSDGKNDEIRDIVTHYQGLSGNLYQTYVPETVYSVSRKKLGITLGIKAARYDVVALTEAYCCPTGERWLQSVGRNFIGGVDVVLGYVRLMSASGRKDSGYKVFDRIVFALRYMSYAVLRRPYMGVGCNLAYRKETFFANKGFSSTLNLHFGDDDLFVNEVATASNTRIEVSPESMVAGYCANSGRSWDEMRLRYDFTAKYMRTTAKAVFRMETVLHCLFWCVALCLLCVGIPNVLCCVAAVLLFAAYWVTTSLVYRRAGRMFGERLHAGLVPFYQLLRPWFALRYAVMGRKGNKCNFTWQYLR